MKRILKLDIESYTQEIKEFSNIKGSWVYPYFVSVSRAYRKIISTSMPDPFNSKRLKVTLYFFLICIHGYFLPHSSNYAYL